MLLANLLRGDEALVGVVRRHADVDDRDVGFVAANLEQQVVGRRGLADDLEPRSLEQARDALAHQDRVLGDDDPQRLAVGHAQRSAIRCAESSSFGTKPRAPLSRTWEPKCASSRVEVSTTAGPPSPASCPATSSPSRSGSWTSSSTTSGSSSRAAASAARPSPASPTTSKPSDSSNLLAMPRKRWSSSTMRMRATFASSQTPLRPAVRVTTLFVGG